jgi:Zn-dependent protease with chaperone function
VAGDGEAFARALEQLCRSALAERRPPWLARVRASHPPPGERIEAARGLR